MRHAVGAAIHERLWLALVPDDKGWVAVACEGPGADRAGVVPRRRRQPRGRDADGVDPGPDPDVAAAIGSAVTALNGVRTSTRRGLRSRVALTRARAAASMASAHRDAAGKVAASGARPQEREPVKALADGLLAQAETFDRLAAAARRRRVARYDAARDAIARREVRLRAAFDDLREIGYGT